MTDSPLNPASPLFGALALELSMPAPNALATSAKPSSPVLAQREAGELAALMARDLAGFDKTVTQLELSTVGAHYDPIELLRPRWPLFDELDQLSARAPGEDKARIVAYGAHEGRLPGNLAPSTDQVGGPLRLVPFVLRGAAADIASVGETLERDLMETGMAGAETALRAQQVFGLRIEHARYLTLHDLCAMIALHYDYAGLSPLWPLIETALLSPAREAWLDAPPEPLLCWRDGEVRIAMLPPDAWRARYAATLDDAQAERLHGHYEARQRQFASVLAAHAIPVTFVHCDAGDTPQARLHA